MKLTLKKNSVKQLSNDVTILPKEETAAIAGGLATANKTIVSVMHTCVCLPSRENCS